MKKTLLGTLLVPAFALAACSGNGGNASSDFRKCTYLSINGTVVVSEDGYYKQNKIVGSYAVNEDDFDEISDNYFSDFPTSFTVFDNYQTFPTPYEQEDPVLPSTIPLTINAGGEYKNYTLTLKENSTAIYETYSDYYFSKATNEIKAISHEDVRKSTSHASYESAYLYSGQIYVQSDVEDYPTNQFKVANNKYPLKEKSREVYIILSSDMMVTYALEEEPQE